MIRVEIFCSSSVETGHQKTAIPVTSLKVGDEVMLRVQGGARHTGIEIQEFIVENFFFFFLIRNQHFTYQDCKLVQHLKQLQNL